MLELIHPEKPADRQSLSETAATGFPLSETAAAGFPLSETAAAELLSGYSWPGNIRQLQSVARRFALLVSTPEDICTASDANRISVTHENLRCLKQCLEQEAAVAEYATPSSAAKNAPAETSAGALSSNKNFVIHGRLVSWEELKALDQYYQGHRSLLAKQLGVSRSTLWRYFKEMEADRP